MGFSILIFRGSREGLFMCFLSSIIVNSYFFVAQAALPAYARSAAAKKTALLAFGSDASKPQVLAHLVFVECMVLLRKNLQI